jgi:hypothetical protein
MIFNLKTIGFSKNVDKTKNEFLKKRRHINALLYILALLE